jgi:sucrose phosphorylase
MIPDGVMFNAYPDSCGGTLGDIVNLLKREEFEGLFSYFYILPSMFQSDLDRGFSVISYDLNRELADSRDLGALEEMGIELKLDFVLNHLSSQSPQFQDLLEKGDDSLYVDAFIDWNKFWEGHGEMSEEGYIVPEQKYLSVLFMRKPGLPILKVPFPDGSNRFYWNTFYQSNDPDSLLAQVDLNAESQVVWNFYDATMEKLASYGGRIVRLDAFAYLHKEIGSSNFFNEPGTWQYLARIRKTADRLGITLLPEIHSKYGDKTHEKLAENGYAFYDFFFPGLVINAIESGDGTYLASWIREVRKKGFSTVNMLGCHDGIPVLDLTGYLPDSIIEETINLITDRGGVVKNLYGPDGEKISYYQVNATFYSALGEDPQKLLLARAIQLFMPGVPEVWYLDIFAGTNDYKAAQEIGHKAVNRTNLTSEQIEERLQWPLVQKQLELLRFRNTFPAFGRDAELTIGGDSGRLELTWRRDGRSATLSADLKSVEFVVRWNDGSGEEELSL